ncbi:hypothetical protein HK101_000174 [Irineochytrium annulatum]|nr:hypothetical protein HK101_000174 [Irineochytrium annulatum]
MVNLYKALMPSLIKDQKRRDRRRARRAREDRGDVDETRMEDYHDEEDGDDLHEHAVDAAAAAEPPAYDHAAACAVRERPIDTRPIDQRGIVHQQGTGIEHHIVMEQQHAVEQQLVTDLPGANPFADPVAEQPTAHHTAATAQAAQPAAEQPVAVSPPVMDHARAEQIAEIITFDVEGEELEPTIEPKVEEGRAVMEGAVLVIDGALLPAPVAPTRKASVAPAVAAELKEVVEVTQMLVTEEGERKD